MSEIELGNQTVLPNQFRSRVILGELKRPKVLDFILKTGVVKSETAAVRVMLFGAGVIFLASLIIFSQTFGNEEEIPPLNMEAIRTNTMIK